MKIREGRKLQSQSFGKGSIFVTIGDLNSHLVLMIPLLGKLPV